MPPYSGSILTDYVTPYPGITVSPDYLNVTVDTSWSLWTTASNATTGVYHAIPSTSWGQWCDDTTVRFTNVTLAADTATEGTWVAWASYGPHELPKATPEQVAHVTEAAERQKRATARSRELLLAALNKKQQAELEKHGHFHVHTANGVRTYRLRPGLPPRLVKGEDHEFTFCIHPEGGFPADDVALAVKLLLDTDEAEFLRIANATRVAA